MMKNNFIPTMIILILIISSCSNPQKEFEKIKKENNIESFNQFIEKYPEHDLTKNAIRLRDSLVFISAMGSNNIDSLEWFITEFPESNFLSEAKQELSIFKEELALYNKKDEREEPQEKLAAITNYLSTFPEGRFLNEAKTNGAELNKDILSIARDEAKKGLSSKNNNSAADAFVKSAEMYLSTIDFLEFSGQDTSKYYERAAYAYYKAADRKMAVTVKQFASVFNQFAKEEINLQDFQKKSRTNPDIALRNKYFQKSIELYKKAGKADHAKWMEKGGDMKNFKSEDIEKEWNS